MKPLPGTLPRPTSSSEPTTVPGHALPQHEGPCAQSLRSFSGSSPAALSPCQPGTAPGWPQTRLPAATAEQQCEAEPRAADTQRQDKRGPHELCSRPHSEDEEPLLKTLLCGDSLALLSMGRRAQVGKRCRIHTPN